MIHASLLGMGYYPIQYAVLPKHHISAAVIVPVDTCFCLSVIDTPPFIHRPLLHAAKQVCRVAVAIVIKEHNSRAGLVIPPILPCLPSQAFIFIHHLYPPLLPPVSENSPLKVEKVLKNQGFFEGIDIADLLWVSLTK